MGSSKTAADTESGKFTETQAGDAGWKIWQVRDARAVKTGVTGGGHGEFIVEDELWSAEKTVDDHLITATGNSKEQLLENIRSQQSSIDSAVKRTPALLVVNDEAGDADGDENVGLAGVLPETKVDRELLAANTGQTP